MMAIRNYSHPDDYWQEREAELVEALTELAHAVSPKLRGGPFAIDWDTDALEPCFTRAMDKACKALATHKPASDEIGE